MSSEFVTLLRKNKGTAFEDARKVERQGVGDDFLPDGDYTGTVTIRCGKTKNNDPYIVFELRVTSENEKGKKTSNFHELAEKGGRTLQMAYEMMFSDFQAIGYETGDWEAESIENALKEVNDNKPEVRFTVENKDRYKNVYLNGLVESDTTPDSNRIPIGSTVTVNDQYGEWVGEITEHLDGAYVIVDENNESTEVDETNIVNTLSVGESQSEDPPAEEPPTEEPPAEEPASDGYQSIEPGTAVMVNNEYGEWAGVVVTVSDDVVSVKSDDDEEVYPCSIDQVTAAEQPEPEPWVPVAGEACIVADATEGDWPATIVTIAKKTATVTDEADDTYTVSIDDLKPPA